jgi:hypothetical protein
MNGNPGLSNAALSPSDFQGTCYRYLLPRPLPRKNEKSATDCSSSPVVKGTLTVLRAAFCLRKKQKEMRRGKTCERGAEGGRPGLIPACTQQCALGICCQLF